MHSKRVEFRTADGILLRGDYYPVEINNAPIIIMTQGVRFHSGSHSIPFRRLT
jgi:hypothetical protein